MFQDSHQHPLLGTSMYERAKNVIPGGTNLLSKRPEMWVVDGWPNYYKWAKGCKVISIDNKKFYDFSTNSVGACVLGYNNKLVNRAAIHAIKNSNISTLNHANDIYLAERLLGIHPWARGVKFSRGGGEALAIAIRIARNLTNKSGVIVTGYHGWHDWYLSANLENDALGNSGIHLKDLSAKGVPSQLSGTVKAAEMHNIESIDKCAQELQFNLAAIVIEISRYSDPPKFFLEQIKEKCKAYKCLLIVDEVTSGFRFNLGGLHLKHNLVPNISVYAKAIGNGFPIGATLLDVEAFDAAKSTFISSTSWSENIGPAAALATINNIEKLETWKTLDEAGRKVMQIWSEEASDSKIDVRVLSPKVNSIVKLEFMEENPSLLRSLWCKLMLEEGFLDNGLFYPTIAHKDGLINKYALAVKKVMKLMSKISKDNSYSNYIIKESHQTFLKI